MGMNQMCGRARSCISVGVKPFATRPTIKQITILVLSILATNGDIALVAQTVILALFIGAEMLLKVAHRVPPV
ncbi:MAG: hypothetical protein V2B20_27875 [Pseudomonadota bacterium]